MILGDARWFAAGFTLLLVGAAAAGERASGPFAAAIDAARERVVKIYGGQLGRQEGYASGILIGADGRVLTTLSALLETPALRVVLPDGRRFSARVEARDARRRLALLRLDGDSPESPHFDLFDAPRPAAGDWVITASNAFGVAMGPEPVSVSVGLCGGHARLDARRRAQEIADSGEIILTDIITANPGAAGGAMVDLDGRLIGMIGERLTSRATNTWLNYAIPAADLAAFVAAVERGDPLIDDADHAGDALRSVDLGLRLFDVGGRTQLAYIERVRDGSPAALAGLRPDDLILAVDDRAISSCAEFEEWLRGASPEATIDLLVKRGDEVLNLRILSETGHAP